MLFLPSFSPAIFLYLFKFLWIALIHQFKSWKYCSWMSWCFCANFLHFNAGIKQKTSWESWLLMNSFCLILIFFWMKCILNIRKNYISVVSASWKLADWYISSCRSLPVICSVGAPADLLTDVIHLTAHQTKHMQQLHTLCSFLFFKASLLSVSHLSLSLSLLSSFFPSLNTS